MSAFETPLTLTGPLRRPRQMLADQEYDGHVSIHDDEMAEKLGFTAGPIEGPTHFSQFIPLLDHLWGQRWHEHGCISAHYQNMCVDGDEVQASVQIASPAADRVSIEAHKADGTPVLTGTASVGPAHGETELEARRERLRAPEKLVILRDIEVGMRGAEPESVRMGFHDHMGDLYPFSLADKLGVITEPSPWYDPSTAGDSPWGRAIIPFEMVSVLTQYASRLARFPARGPAVGLFADLEIRMVDGPLFVDEPYTLEREVIALSESRRTESYWIETRVLDASGALKAIAVLNSAVLKESYARYEEELAAL